MKFKEVLQEATKIKNPLFDNSLDDGRPKVFYDDLGDDEKGKYRFSWPGDSMHDARSGAVATSLKDGGEFDDYKFERYNTELPKWRPHFAHMKVANMTDAAYEHMQDHHDLYSMNIGKDHPHYHFDQDKNLVSLKSELKNIQESQSNEKHTFEGLDEDGNRINVYHSHYPWGKFIKIERGISETFPLHPEHQEKIRNLDDGESTIFKVETGNNVTATRTGDRIQLKNNYSAGGVSVSRHHFTE